MEAIGLYYVVVGIVMYVLSLRSHPAFFVFSLLGVALLVPLWISRRL